MKQNIQKLYNNKIVRYIFFGGCTTLVNLVVFSVLRYTVHLELQVANIISIVCAILFAYITNKLFVFDAGGTTARTTLLEFIQFFVMRIGTLVIEVVGVEIMTRPFKISEFLSKLTMQFVIIVLNYFISKFFVFHRKGEPRE